MKSSPWPVFREPPSVAFVDVDGTLLAQTTTFLFARILYRRGLIRRSFVLRALYHGLQHRFGRLEWLRHHRRSISWTGSVPMPRDPAQQATGPAVEPKDVGDRDIPVAIYEELRALRRTLQLLAILAAPLMLLGVLALLQFLEGWR